MSGIIRRPGEAVVGDDLRSQANAYLRNQNMILVRQLEMLKERHLQVAEGAYCLSVAVHAYQDKFGELSDEELVAAEAKWREEIKGAIHIDRSHVDDPSVGRHAGSEPGRDGVGGQAGAAQESVPTSGEPQSVHLSLL